MDPDLEALAGALEPIGGAGDAGGAPGGGGGGGRGGFGGAGGGGEPRGGEAPLPDPLAARRWILAVEGVREEHRAVPPLEVALVETADLEQGALEGLGPAARGGG